MFGKRQKMRFYDINHLTRGVEADGNISSASQICFSHCELRQEYTRNYIHIRGLYIHITTYFCAYINSVYMRSHVHPQVHTYTNTQVYTQAYILLHTAYIQTYTYIHT